MSITIHTCCGCSCHVCALYHSSGFHTEECCRRFITYHEKTLILAAWNLLTEDVRTASQSDNIDDLIPYDKVQRAESTLKSYGMQCPFDAQFGR